MSVSVPLYGPQHRLADLPIVVNAVVQGVKCFRDTTCTADKKPQKGLKDK